MTAAKRFRSRQGLALALIEQREQDDPGTRSRWTVALVQLDATGTHTVMQWRGTGPLGRLRARRDAIEHCARASLTVTPSFATERPTPAHVEQAHAALHHRLRSEGVLNTTSAARRADQTSRKEPVR